MVLEVSECSDDLQDLHMFWGVKYRAMYLVKRDVP